MATPYIFEENFELGTAGDFDSTADTDAASGFPRYDTLANVNRNRGAGGYTPYTGAFCRQIVLAGGTNPVTMEGGDMNLAADGTTNYYHFNILFGLDFQGTADDTCGLLKLEQSNDTAEVVCGFRVVTATGAINMGIGETAPTSFSGTALTRGLWYTVELACLNAAGGTGTIDMWVTADGDAVSTTVAATQVGSLTQGAIAQGTFGIEDHLATTTGTILLDNLIQDDARIYTINRFGPSRRITKRGHAFVGSGTIDDIVVTSDDTNACSVEIFDTDNADNLSAPIARVNVEAAEIQNNLGHPLLIKNGCYVQFGGTANICDIYVGDGVPQTEEAVRRLGKGGR
tara:strand:+ start:205 stop:1233 length:1029 start_codon:yes stop_codon:yes gene_type:complete